MKQKAIVALVLCAVVGVILVWDHASGLDLEPVRSEVPEDVASQELVPAPDASILSPKVAGSLIDGKQIVPFPFQDIEGTSHDLSDYIGRPLMINVWATWCPPCIAEFPLLLEVAETYKDQGLVILTLSVDRNPKVIPRFIGSLKPELQASARASNFILGVDSDAELSRALRIFRYPETLFVDRTGRIRGRIPGMVSRSQVSVFMKMMDVAGG